MSNAQFKEKTIILEHNGRKVVKEVKADLDRVYVGGYGDTFVYYDANVMKDGKHLFILGDSDNTIANMKKFFKSKQ